MKGNRSEGHNCTAALGGGPAALGRVKGIHDN